MEVLSNMFVISTRVVRAFAYVRISGAVGTAGGRKKLNLGGVLESIRGEGLGDLRGVFSKYMQRIGRMYCVSSGSMG